MKIIKSLRVLLIILITFNISYAQKNPSGESLRDVVKEKYPDANVFIGASTYDPDSDLGRILAREFGYITPSNDFKQSRIHPEPGVWNWDQADRWVDYAEKNNQVIRIHGPISPQCSKWARQDHRTAEELEKNMEEFLTALCIRYNGTKNILWMDVINETVNPDGSWMKSKPGITWESPWEKMGYQKTPPEYKHLGGEIPVYILEAFRIASAFAPDIKLVINQHLGMEEAAWNKVKDMVLYLRSLGYRVDGVGWQAHIKLIDDDPSQWETGSINTNELSDLISWMHKNDLEFHVTENNIHVKPEDEDKQDVHSQVFTEIVRTLLEHRNTGVVTWNLWDIKNVDLVQARKPRVKIGLWNRKLKPNKSYYEIQKLLENPPPAK